MQKLAVILFCLVTTHIRSQSIQVVESGRRVSMRGLSVVSDDVIWASGTGGNIARSTNGGASFTWMKVPGYEKMDFRDIEAFDSNTAIIMGITAPAVVLKTKDGGKTWKKVFEDTAKAAFIDAMDFFDNQNGMILGDPVKANSLYHLVTSDGGDTWSMIDHSIGNASFFGMNEGEAFFASSGTNLQMISKTEAVIASGGKSSRLYYKNQATTLPIMQGKESTGANSVAVNGKYAVVVGGDFSKDTISSNNCVLISLGTTPRFSAPVSNPHGYRSCVIYLNNTTLLTCGTSGVDISKDGGKNWELITKDGFHVCRKAKKGTAVFLAGNGKIARFTL